MRKLKIGIAGVGYIGISHVEAVRRIGYAEVAAVADSNVALAEQRASEYQIPRCYHTMEEMLCDGELDVIHNCTPNNLHFSLNKKILEAGKHLFSEKPLTRTAQEGEQLVQLLRQTPTLCAGVNFNYRMNPLIQEMQKRILAGELGRPMLVHGSYLQDWLLYETDYNWRVEPEICGPSRCVADIGSHWMDLAQFLLGSRISAVCADKLTAFPVRKKAKQQVETFSRNTDLDYEDKKVVTEDYAAVLFRMENGVHGVFHVSEISAGRGCCFSIEVDGTRSSFAWNQETCDQMWQGFRDEDNRLILRNPNAEHASPYTHLAKGHPEGWNDAFKNNIQCFYDYVLAREAGDNPAPRFVTLEDALYLLRLTEAIMESGDTGAWVSL